MSAPAPRGDPTGPGAGSRHKSGAPADGDGEPAREVTGEQPVEGLRRVLTTADAILEALEGTRPGGSTAMIDRREHTAPRPTLTSRPGLRERVSSGRGEQHAPDDLDLLSTMLDLQVLQMAHQDAIDVTARVLHPALLEFLR